MMEKPLAVSNADAQRIRRAADRGRHRRARELRDDVVPEPRRDLDARQGTAGRRRHPQDGRDGRPQAGPRPSTSSRSSSTGCPIPVRNGGGALFDFGCYGANLMTWLMDNQRPLPVTAVTQQFQPAVYPRVDDEATILLEYPTGAGHHPGVVELAVQPQGLRGLRRERARDRHRRQRPARGAAEGAGPRGHAGSPRAPTSRTRSPI